MDEQQTILEGFTETAVQGKKTRKLKAASAPRPSAADEGQIISYRHLDRRKNNPEVGVINASTDPDTPNTVWNYDPHLDPALQFDSGRSSIETLIDDALASGDEAEMRSALEEPLDQLHGTVSLPFEAGDNRKVAVKIVDDRGIESSKIIPLED